MALIKLGGLITALSGKIGGQSISNRGTSTTIRNIGYSNKIASPKQSLQRFLTASISNTYQFLTGAQISSWSATASNYTYTNRVGDTVARNGFQTFNFVNQNLKLIGASPLNNAPVFVPAVDITVSIDVDYLGSLVVSSPDASNDYIYGLFARPNLPIGVVGQAGLLKFCGNVSEAELTAGIDLIPLIEAIYGPITFDNNIAFSFAVINQNTGNRVLDPAIYNSLVLAGLPSTFDADYQAILDYATLNGFSQPTAGQQIIQNQLMIDLKAVIPLSAFDLLFVLVNDAGSNFSWINWANGQNFSQTGTWRFESNIGNIVRSTTGIFFTSNFDMSSDTVAYTLNDASFGLKVGNLPLSWNSGDNPIFANGGSGSMTPQNQTLQSFRINDQTFTTMGTISSLGRFDDVNCYTVCNRIDASTKTMMRNGSLISTKTQASTALPNVLLQCGSYSGSFPTPFQLIHVGRSLTLTEHQDILTVFNNYLSSI